MSVQISPNLPANVVEIGNEITQAKIDQLNAGTVATQEWVASNAVTITYLQTYYQPLSGMSSYLTSTTAASTYQTISGMSSYLTNATASATYAPKASPTFTGTVTIPAGASISGYALLASPTFTGDPKAPTPATTDNDTSIATTAYVKSNLTSYATQTYVSNLYQPLSGMSAYATTSWVNSQGYLTASALTGYATTSWATSAFANKFDSNGVYGAVYDAPADYEIYGRQNNAWVAITGGGSGGLTDAPSDNLTYGRNNGAWVAIDGGGSGGGISDAPSDGQSYVRKDAGWYDLSTYLTYQSYATQSFVTSQGYLTAKTVQSVGSGYQITLGDQNKVLLFTTTMGYDTINLMPDSLQSFPDGTEITICQYPNITGNQISGYWAGQPLINGTGSVALTQTVHKLVKIGYDQWLFS
jgi:hypothetical protein